MKAEITFSIVAVTGWNGKAFWSWKPENSPCMWLRDWLGQDLADNGYVARIFTYGYPATVANSYSDASYHDYGKTFLGHLTSIRRLQYKVFFAEFCLGKPTSLPTTLAELTHHIRRISPDHSYLSGTAWEG